MGIVWLFSYLNSFYYPSQKYFLSLLLTL
jgi:hypothetical protein